jgi:hypothetical protein
LALWTRTNVASLAVNIIKIGASDQRASDADDSQSHFPIESSSIEPRRAILLPHLHRSL